MGNCIAAGRRRGGTLVLLAVASALALAGCSSATGPEETGYLDTGGGAPDDGSLRIAALDFFVGDLHDPAVMARYARADLLILQPWPFWNNTLRTGELELIRAANPDIKIVAYFRPKAVRGAWAAEPRDGHAFDYDLFHAAAPYLAATTTGDTVSDFQGAYVFDFTRRAARDAVLDVLAAYQGTNGNRFDGVYWDYFGKELWIAPNTVGMEGDPDLDGDGVPHWDDADEIAAFRAAQVDMVGEMRQRFGSGFLQIANGNRAVADSSFAALFDGMLYEIFPYVGFSWTDGYRDALDPATPNNLWRARNWPRTRNGGPWLILAQVQNVGGFTDQDGEYRRVDPGDLGRVLSLLTGTTCLHYDLTGAQSAGIPTVEYDLGRPLGPAEALGGSIYRRSFERGSVEMTMGTGAYPVPFTYFVRDAEGRNIQVLAPPYAYP